MTNQIREFWYSYDYECNLSPVILKGDQIKGVKLLHFLHFHINFPRLKTREIMRIDKNARDAISHFGELQTKLIFLWSFCRLCFAFNFFSSLVQTSCNVRMHSKWLIALSARPRFGVKLPGFVTSPFWQICSSVGCVVRDERVSPKNVSTHTHAVLPKISLFVLCACYISLISVSVFPSLTWAMHIVAFGKVGIDKQGSCSEISLLKFRVYLSERTHLLQYHIHELGHHKAPSIRTTDKV